MINQEKFFNTLTKAGIEFFAGVPDSYLNAFCTYLAGNVPENRHVIAANEGSAISLAAGYHFSTGTVPLVYMQNSGMGNALNPIVSLVDKHVYSVPMVLVIGWRGDPEGKDHEQHMTQGIITTKLLEMLDIPYVILEDSEDSVEETVEWAVKTARESGYPTALIAKNGILAEKEKKPPVDDKYPMTREDVIQAVLDTTPEDTIIVATTGRATRELYFIRGERNETRDNDILNVGSMGHASSIAMGIALAKPDRLVVCLDGDSAAIMHMGVLSTVSKYPLPNYIHIILNNGAHESVGGQPSVGHLINFSEIAKNCGYRSTMVSDEMELKKALSTMIDSQEVSFIDARIRQGMRPVLPPLKINHNELIQNFKNKNISKENN